MTLRTLDYGNYGIFLIMGNAGFCPSTVVLQIRVPFRVLCINKAVCSTRVPAGSGRLLQVVSEFLLGHGWSMCVVHG